MWTLVLEKKAGELGIIPIMKYSVHSMPPVSPQKGQTQRMETSGTNGETAGPKVCLHHWKLFTEARNWIGPLHNFSIGCHGIFLSDSVGQLKGRSDEHRSVALLPQKIPLDENNPSWGIRKHFYAKVSPTPCIYLTPHQTGADNRTDPPTDRPFNG